MASPTRKAAAKRDSRPAEPAAGVGVTDIGPRAVAASYTAVSLRELIAVIERAERRGGLKAALRKWKKDLRDAGDADAALVSSRGLDAGKQAFLLFGLCRGATGTAGAVIRNLVVNVVAAGMNANLDVKFNAVVVSGRPCGPVTIASAALTVTPPGAAARTLPLTLGPPPPLPPLLVPAPAAPAVDIPASGRVTVGANVGAALGGTVAALTVTFKVSNVGGWCDSCAQAPAFTAAAAATVT